VDQAIAALADVEQLLTHLWVEAVGGDVGPNLRTSIADATRLVHKAAQTFEPTTLG
jgi:hypothetical protein